MIRSLILNVFSIFFFNDTATTEIYTLSLHDALPIWPLGNNAGSAPGLRRALEASRSRLRQSVPPGDPSPRSEEHTSELQSRLHLVCRLLLEKKKKNTDPTNQFLLSITHLLISSLHDP